MDDHTGGASVAPLLTSFAQAGPDRLDVEFDRLVAALWRDGTLTADAVPTGPALVELFDRVGDDRRAHLAVLLGLLVEAEHPRTDGPMATAVRAGLDRYLEVLARGGERQPLTLALLYLVAHFPADRDRILAATRQLTLTPPDRTRLARSLADLDLNDPDIGRAWPSPSEWALTEEEREFDRGWIRALSTEQITKTWHGDTRSVLAYSGAQAYWALTNGAPTTTPDASPYAGSVPTDPGELDASVLARHAAALRCPDCGGGLAFAGRQAQCTACGDAYGITHGVLDLSRRLRAGAGVSDDEADVQADVLQNAAVMRGIGFHYEEGLRPNFLRVMGGNWAGQVTPADEDAYLTEHLRHRGGTVLDLAAGAGRWTAVVAKAVGADRVLALDLNEAMLFDLRSRLPEVPAVRASALELPFADRTLDAVNCWNALQALPDAGQAIQEVGRCLRPGGVLTLMTFRWSDSPVYRYFQASHHFPARPDGFLLFTREEIGAWLERADLEVESESGPGTFVFVTARRRG